MAVEPASLLAQEEPGWTKLLYLLIFFVFPVLNSLGEKIRKWAADKRVAKDAQPGRPTPAPKGVVGGLQPAKQIVIRGERPASAPAVPLARAPRPQTQRRQAATPPRPATPMPARPVRPQKRHTKSTPPQQMTDARRERLAAIEKLARVIPEVSARRAHTPRSIAPLLPGRVDPASLRSVIVLSEILRPPLALRDDRLGGL